MAVTFTFLQDSSVFETIWESTHNNNKIHVSPTSNVTYNYTISEPSIGSVIQSGIDLTASQLVTALETYIGESVSFPVSIKGNTPTPS
jgi:hypothetical protein